MGKKPLHKFWFFRQIDGILRKSLDFSRQFDGILRKS